MAGQQAHDLHLKVDKTGNGAFIDVAVLRNSSILFSAIPFDVIDTELSEVCRTYFRTSKLVRIAGIAVFKSAIAEEIVTACFDRRIVMEWRILFPALGLAEGLLLVHRLEPLPAMNDERTFKFGMEAAGEIKFMEAAPAKGVSFCGC